MSFAICILVDFFLNIFFMKYIWLLLHVSQKHLFTIQDLRLSDVTSLSISTSTKKIYSLPLPNSFKSEWEWEQNNTIWSADQKRTLGQGNKFDSLDSITRIFPLWLGHPVFSVHYQAQFATECSRECANLQWTYLEYYNILFKMWLVPFCHGYK